jgi:hypothetical protein
VLVKHQVLRFLILADGGLPEPALHIQKSQLWNKIWRMGQEAAAARGILTGDIHISFFDEDGACGWLVSAYEPGYWEEYEY